MTAKRIARLGDSPRTRAKAFTLVELMVVMFIMSVVAALVVGVSWYVIQQGRKSETRDKQRKLVEAINAYRKVTGHVPDIDYGPDLANSDTATPPRYKDKSRLMLALIQILWGYSRPSTYTSNIGSPDYNSAEYKATRPWLGSGAMSLTSDAYGNTMLYLKNRGFGGTPRIVSAGPDKMFGDEIGLANPAQYQSDNIYSDQ